MPDEPIEGVKPAAEPALPAISEGTPLPGQAQEPKPGEEPATSEPQSGEPTDADKTVPLAALHEERTKRQEAQAELEVLKQMAGPTMLYDVNGNPVQAQPAAQPGQQAPDPGQPNRAAEELDRLWEDEPRKAVQVEIMAAMSYRDQQEANVDQQVMQASRKYDDFGTYDTTVRQYIRALPLEQRSKAGVVDLAYYVVKGQNTGNAVEAAKAEVLRKIQAGENVQGLPGGTRPAAPQAVPNELNTEQLAVAEAMGLTADEYKSAMVKQ